MTTECINLWERFGDRYWITFDESYDPAGVLWEKRDPWMQQIPCRGGITIYPYGGDLLAVEVDYHPKTAKALAALPGARLHQDGDKEKTVVVPVALFEQVAALVRPRLRRQYTEEEKARLASLLTAEERRANLAKAWAKGAQAS